jgi:hypothetical protein
MIRASKSVARDGARRWIRAIEVSAVLCAALLAVAAGASAHVLHVGTFEGKRGGKSLQKAIERAVPGDWILVAPGDYKETSNHLSSGASPGEAGAGVLIEKSDIHIRGMNRNGVIIDGTKKRTPQCSGSAADQELGSKDAEGNFSGRNGVEVFKATGVSVENLTVCNFQAGHGGGGNQVWFNFGDGSGVQMAGGWRGAFLSATDSFYDSTYFGSYGIFTSNTAGPGLYTQVYANNMADSAFYIGGCPDCNTTLDHAHAENSDLGYSGTNSGGHLIIQHSEFDNNQSGFVSNSQNNDDAPSPQDGACPNNETGPTGTHSCWVFEHNRVHDNNNPNVPTTGAAAAGPVGSGVVLAGDHNDIVTENQVYNNGAWGILLVPYPDTETPPPISHCEGGTEVETEGQHVCYYDDFGNEVEKNTLTNNGFFGNQSNVDLAELSNPELTGNCWHGNVDTGGEVTSEPKAIQTPPHSQCGIPDSGEPLASSLGTQVACDTQLLFECPPTAVAIYPRREKVDLMALPEQRTMEDPCAGVPRNSWCPTNPSARKTPPYPVPGATVE